MKKVKILKYCQVRIEGQLVIFNCNEIRSFTDEMANQLIKTNLADVIEDLTDTENVSVNLIENNAENKMINIVYKKRGRPRKEV